MGTHIRNDVIISKDKRSKTKPWIVRWWGKYDVQKEKQTRHSKGFRTKKEAERYAQKLQNPETRSFLEGGKLTLGELCDKYLKAFKPTLRYSSYTAYDQTVDRLKNYFTPFCPIGSITKEDSITFINNLNNLVTGDRASDSTKSRHLRESRRIFNIAKDWDYIRKNPFDGISLGKIQTKDWHPISPSEFANVLRSVEANCRITKKNEAADRIRILRIKAFYSVMYYCGLRFGEAANLLWDNGDIDFETNQINIANRSAQDDIPSFAVKDHEARSISVPQKVMEMLAELEERSEPGSPFVFLSPKAYERLVVRWHIYCKHGEEDWGNKFVITNARRDFKNFCDKAGIKTKKVLTIQSLRKGYGTNMANLGVPPNTLKDLMGHSSITTTMNYYVKTLDENKIAAAEKLNAIAVI